VTHLVHRFGVGGMEIGIAKLVNGLDPSRITSTIFSALPTPGDGLRERLNPGIKVIEFNRRRGNDPALVGELYRLFKRERPHVVHTHRWATLCEGLVAARLAGVPFVVHGEHGTLETRRHNARVQRWAWRYVDRVLSVSSRLAERMGALRVGDGTAEGVDVGPLITDKARTGVHELVQDAVSGGARALVGGEVPDGPGHFYPPTVLVDVPASARVFREEIFGPVAPVSTFRDEEEAVRRATDTEYGLVAYVFTRDHARVLRVSEALEFGMVGVNTGIVSNPAAPFGGVKHSGFGREGGFEGIEEYLETKYVGSAL
jgi:hypothetical protein